MGTDDPAPPKNMDYLLTIAKPDYTAGVYSNDLLMKEISKETRFETSYDDLTQESGVLSQIATAISFATENVQLPTAEIWNFIANVFLHLRTMRQYDFPDLGATTSWEWCQSSYGSDSRLIVGGRGHGGLAAVHRHWSENRSGSIAFRVLAVF